MRETSASEYRARGGSYPNPACDAFAAYPDLQGETLGAHDRLGALARAPSPAAVRRLLCGDAQTPLHDPRFDAMFVGTLDRIWAWPGAREFGVVVLLNPWSLSPVRAGAFDGYLVSTTTIDPDATAYAPDEEVASLVAGARTWAEARSALPSDYGARLRAALQRVDGYISEAVSMAPTLDRLETNMELAREWGLDDAKLSAPLFHWNAHHRERLRELSAHGGPQTTHAGER